MSDQKAETTKLRVVQSKTHLEEKLDVEISSRLAIAYRRVRGARVEGFAMVREAVELLHHDTAAEGEIPRSLHKNRTRSASEIVNISCD